MLERADATFKTREYARALDEYREAAEAASKAGQRGVQVEALAQVARCLSLTGKLEEGRPVLEEAAKLASSDEPLGWSRLLGVRGIFARESGDKAAAKKLFEEMHAYCIERKLWSRAIDATHHIAIVVPPEEQPAWNLKGIEAAEQLGDQGWLAVLWNNLGAAYEDLKQHDKMLDAYLKARDYHHKASGDVQKLAADWAVGHGYRLCGKPREAREWLEKALPWAEKRHRENPGHETIEWVGWCKKDLGEALVDLGDKEKGVALMKEGRAALVEAGIEKWWPDALKKLDESLKALDKP